jgi:hypothetical protein
VWAQVSVAALAVCLNETPALARQMGDQVPATTSIAQRLLVLAGPLGVTEAGATPVCDPTAPARATGVAGVAFLGAMIVLDRGGVSRALAWPLLLATAAAIQAALFFMPGLWSSDILDYASHGRVAAIHSANPYVVTPSAFPDDPFANLGAWAGDVTVYGPVWTRIEVWLTSWLGPSAGAVSSAFAFKAVGLASYLACALLIWWITREWQVLGLRGVSPLVSTALWVWNPLVNIEVVGSAHNEGFMSALVLAAFAVLTAALRRRRLDRLLPWTLAIASLWLGALVKFVPAAMAAIVSLVWLGRTASLVSRMGRLLIIVGVVGVITVVMAWPWLDTPAIAQPLVGLAAGGERFKDAWQDSPADWVAVRPLRALGVPDTRAVPRMEVARTILWGITRTIFAVYVAIEAWRLWHRTTQEGASLVFSIAAASARALLLAVLLYISQVYAWYFLWPVPLACLVGWRNAWARAAVIFGVCFLPAFYLREFQSYGLFYVPMPLYAALAIVAVTLLAERVPRILARA